MFSYSLLLQPTKLLVEAFSQRFERERQASPICLLTVSSDFRVFSHSP